MTTIQIAQIEALRAEAWEAGDYVTVEDCDAALAGDEQARERCEQIIADAQAEMEA